ncbi:MAG: hypothetical protein ABL864_09160 [Terricaulis sp.]
MVDGVSPALVHAYSRSAEPLTQSAIKALMHVMARECYWTIESFDWRVVHRTYHRCIALKEEERFVALIGVDAPIFALSGIREDQAWSFFDDASIVTAAAGYYGPTLRVLQGGDLSSDLTERDRDWLRSVNKNMNYDLRYWNPQTVGQVVFNFWD